jgi:xylulokinase
MAGGDPGTFIVAHDVGTSGVKSVLTDARGTVLARHITGYPTHFPQPGWAEQETGDWWRAVSAGSRQVTAALPTGGDVACLTFSSQMLGLVPMGADGTVLRRPVIWLDGRAGPEATAVMRRLGGPRVFSRLAGATLTGKDGIPKLRWLRDHEPEVWRGMACFLDVGGYLTYRCTGRMSMDWTEASVYGFDLRRKTWLTGIMRYAGIDPAKLPPLLRPTEIAGVLTREAAGDLGLRQGTPVVAGLGDAPAAAIGAGAVGPGDTHAYLGTSGWIGVTTAGHPTGRHGIAVIASGDPDHNLLIAEMETGGECFAWLAAEMYQADATGRPEAYRRMDADAARVPPGSGLLLFTPWMYGERVPVADTFLRSAFLNLGPGHHREHMVRAVLEGVCFNYRWTLERLGHDFHVTPARLRVIGGGARSAVWMQILADVTGLPVETVRDPENAGAVGAALAAGVALGIHPDFASLRGLVEAGSCAEPRPECGPVYDFLFGEYRHAYRRLRGFYHALNSGGAPGSASAPGQAAQQRRAG